eukprot:4333476-Prymnesium_polylepis.1
MPGGLNYLPTLAHARSFAAFTHGRPVRGVPFEFCCCMLTSCLWIVGLRAAAARPAARRNRNKAVQTTVYESAVRTAHGKSW